MPPFLIGHPFFLECRSTSSRLATLVLPSTTCRTKAQNRVCMHSWISRKSLASLRTQMTTSINFNFSNNDVRNNAYYAMIVIVPGFATECIRVNSISLLFCIPEIQGLSFASRGPQKSSIAAILSILGLVHFLQTFHNNSNCILKHKSKSTTTGHIFYHTDAKSKNSGKDVAEWKKLAYTYLVY